MDDSYLDHSASEWITQEDGRILDDKGKVPFDLQSRGEGNTAWDDPRSKLDDSHGEVLPRLRLKHFIPFYGASLYERDLEFSQTLAEIRKRYVGTRKLGNFVEEGTARAHSHKNTLKVLDIAYSLALGAGICYLITRNFN